MGRRPADAAETTERLGDPALRWRVLSASLIGAGLLALFASAGPYQADGEMIVATMAAGAVAFGLVLLKVWRRLPQWLLTAIVMSGAVVLDAAVIAAEDPSTPYALFYVWVGASAFFFLRMWQAVLVMGFVAASYGVLLALNPHSHTDEFMRWTFTIGTTIAVGSIAAALRNHALNLYLRASDAAIRDPLTGLLNRRGFDQALEAEVGRATRAGGDCTSVLIADVDGLKNLNVVAGRPAGDAALVRLARLARAGARRSDVLARVSGDELALVLPGTDEHGALMLAERLRRAAHEASSERAAGFTVSIGVATYPKHAVAADGLVNAAEQALFAAKELGRDRCVVYSREVVEALGASEPSSKHRDTEHLAAVLVLAETMDLRDESTARHSHTVARYAETTARELGFDAAQVERVRIAGLLHDIGKIGVPDQILRKPGRLTDAEMAEIKKHPELGARIVEGANLTDVAEWVLAHHERPDGRGYPFGLRGDAIPLEARILAVADSYEAMTADRVYRDAMPEEDAVAELLAGRGAQFDADVVAAFLAARERAWLPLAEALLPDQAARLEVGS